jgi:hypothetical protein
MTDQSFPIFLFYLHFVRAQFLFFWRSYERIRLGVVESDKQLSAQPEAPQLANARAEMGQADVGNIGILSFKKFRSSVKKGGEKD